MPRATTTKPIVTKPFKGAEPVAAAPVAPRRGKDEEKVSPVVTRRVFIHAFSSGIHGSLEAVALHEVPLMRRKLEVFGESLTLSEDWPEFVPRDREVTAAGLREENDRLKARYTFKGNDGQDYDLVADLYGPPHNGRLIGVMRKQLKAWQEAQAAAGANPLSIETLNELVKIADPESDFIEDPDTIKAEA